MASTSNFQTTPSSASSSRSQRQWKYEVFLSFRGETRDIFIGHLLNELSQKFIYTFMDDKRLEIGRPIKKELLDAIEESRMAIVVFSKEYASSTWCLEELVKIVKCMKDRDMKVVPIFYHVDPSDVRKQLGTFRVAFDGHQENLENKDKVQTWRDALIEVANLSGHHLKNGDESKFVKNIVKITSKELSNTSPSDDENNLVGMDSRVKNMYLHYLGVGLQDVRFIGICGMSGMGKTTLARVLFQKYKHLFRARSFIENVSWVSKRNGTVALQENLLSDMKLKDDQEKWDVQKGIDVIRNRLRYTKVLVILDDVDEKEQLETLAGKCNWFGPGSRIVVTTKDEHLLRRHGVKIIYRIKGLERKEALQLFSQEAFNDPHKFEDQEFLDLCNDYVSYADGHPLTLKVLGSSLLGKGREVWKSTLKRLQVLPNSNIQQRLKIGFDALEETEKKMFLDIACFFKGEDKDRVVDLLEGTSDCFPNSDIETLVDKSLITILGRKLWMHSLLQRMGREIVRCEYPQKPGKRSRLWRRDEILEVLRESSGTYKVEGIMLSTLSSHQEEDLNPEAFSNMKKLRLIKMCDVSLPRGLCSLSNQLRLIEWQEYPLASIPESFQPSNLVELIMHRSSFLQLPMAFLNLNKLKVMDFSGSEILMTTPDFSGCPSLQRLIFEGCSRLYEVHPSIGALNQLTLLNLKDCKYLNSFPHEINLESLNLLILSGCSRFSKFPEIGKDMKHLSELYLDGSAIEELPFSIQHLTGLTLLNLGECKKLLIFPTVICCLPVLQTLILSGCKGQSPSPVLFSIGAPLTFSLPSSFSGLTSLVALDLSDCNLLDGALPNDLSGLYSLESLNLRRNNFTRLPESISQLPKLKFLYLDNCNRLELLPNLPSATQFVMARGCTSLKNYCNQVVVSTSGGGEYTVINCLSLAAHEEDVLREVSLLDSHFQPLWMEEQIHQSEEYHGISETAILLWFNQRYGSSISIPLPYDLSKDSCWRGIGLHIVLRTNKYHHGVETLDDASKNVHELLCSLDIDGGLSTCSVVLPKYQFSHYDSFGLCLYISHARFGNHLDQLNCITACFTSNSPDIFIRACGARILYEQDMTEFVQILSQKNLGWIPPVLVQKAERRPRHKFYATSGPLDFHPSTSYSFCFPPIKVQDWFTRQSCGQSVAIDIHPRLYNDESWMGLVLHASFSICRDPEPLIDNCQFRMGTLDGRDDEILSCDISRHEITQFITRGGFCWIAYIPRKKLMCMLDLQGGLKHYTTMMSPSHIAVTFASDCRIITMEKCALRLLYQHDQVQFEQELKHYNDLFSECRDSTGPFMADLEKTNEILVPDDEVVGRQGGTLHTDKDLEVEISIRPILRQNIMSRSDHLDGVYDRCYPPNKVLEWFTHRSDDFLVTIPLHSNDRTSWIGLALCASLSMSGHSSNATDNIDSRLPSNLICHLKTDSDTVERVHTYCLTTHDLKKLRLGGFIWLSYIPRRLFPDFLDECNWIDASISTDYPGLMVQKCGFRILYDEDELNDQFVETENHYWAAYHNEDVWQKLYVDPKDNRDVGQKFDPKDSEPPELNIYSSEPEEDSELEDTPVRCNLRNFWKLICNPFVQVFR